MNKIITSCLFLFVMTVEAAFPITHVYFARLYLKQFPQYSQEEQKVFYIGTLFPDIRYFGKCDRKDTHYDSMTLKEVLDEPNPFMAGMKFHSYVDIVRENYAVKEKVYDHFKNDPHLQTHLKAIEDEILSEQGNYADISYMMGDILPEELNHCATEEVVRKWHQALAFLFITSPTTAFQMAALSGKGFIELSPEEIQEWSKSLKKDAQDEDMQLWIKKLTAHFNQLFLEAEGGPGNLCP